MLVGKKQAMGGSGASKVPDFFKVEPDEAAKKYEQVQYSYPCTPAAACAPSFMYPLFSPSWHVLEFNYCYLQQLICR